VIPFDTFQFLILSMLLLAIVSISKFLIVCSRENLTSHQRHHRRRQETC